MNGIEKRKKLLSEFYKAILSTIVNNSKN